MPYCPECGVELEQFVRICPLCYSKSVKERPENIRNYPVLEADEQEITDKKSASRLKRLFWDLLNLLSLLSIITIIITDLYANNNIEASRYAVSSTIFSWICISSLLAFSNKPYIAGIIIILSSSIFLALLDYFDSNVEWFFILGLPLLGVIAVLLILTGLFIKALKLKGLSIAGIVLLSISIFCCMVNLFVNKYMFNNFYIDWSLIIFVAVIPLVIILIFIQRRLSNEIRINRIFHI